MALTRKEILGSATLSELATKLRAEYGNDMQAVEVPTVLVDKIAQAVAEGGGGGGLEGIEYTFVSGTGTPEENGALFHEAHEAIASDLTKNNPHIILVAPGHYDLRAHHGTIISGRGRETTAPYYALNKRNVHIIGLAPTPTAYFTSLGFVCTEGTWDLGNDHRYVSGINTLEYDISQYPGGFPVNIINDNQEIDLGIWTGFLMENCILGEFSGNGSNYLSGTFRNILGGQGSFSVDVASVDANYPHTECVRPSGELFRISRAYFENVDLTYAARTGNTANVFFQADADSGCFASGYGEGARIYNSKFINCTAINHGFAVGEPSISIGGILGSELINCSVKILDPGPFYTNVCSGGFASTLANVYNNSLSGWIILNSKLDNCRVEGSHGFAVSIGGGQSRCDSVLNNCYVESGHAFGYSSDNTGEVAGTLTNCVSDSSDISFGNGTVSGMLRNCQTLVGMGFTNGISGVVEYSTAIGSALQAVGTGLIAYTRANSFTVADSGKVRLCLDSSHTEVNLG